MTAAEPYRLSPLELACGLILGPTLEVELPPTASTATEAFERATLTALERPPCFVSFSGGRDSSAVLAAAVQAARRRGLPLPIPVTMLFPTRAQTDERRWQELVVAHLDVPDWVRLEPADELDVVGPVARDALKAHGVLWPANTHMHVPVFRVAAGGSLLTGIGGDELFARPRWARVLAVLGRRAPLRLRDLPRLAHALAPGPVRLLVHNRRFPALPAPWLTPAAEEQVRRHLAAEAAREPVRWQRRVRRLAGLRYVQAGTRSFAVLAEDWGVHAVHPFCDLGFLGAVARMDRAQRFAARTEGMARLFGESLPGPTVERATKAAFGHVLWGESARAFAKRWNGEGVDPELVDGEVLRRVWAGPEPDSRTYPLLQAGFLAREADSALGESEQPVAGWG